MARDSELSIWISYEDTLENQYKFISWLEALEEDNRCILPTKRKSFFRLLSKATLTIGRGDRVIYKTKDGHMISMGHLHYFAQKLAYLEKPRLKVKFAGKLFTIEIKELWHLLKDHVLRINPYAQSEALRMSAERFRGQAKPGSVEYKPSTRAYREG